MSISIYDLAVTEKLNSWIKDDNLKILKPNESRRAFELRASQTNDAPLRLPMITLSRDPNITLEIAHKRALSTNGLIIDKQVKQTVQLDAIPINISYQLDIYTKRYEEADEYLRNFIFNLVNHPKLKVLIPYNGSQIEHYAYISVSSEITDNSDITEKKFYDQFTRWTIRFDIKDAFLFSVPVRENKRIGVIALEVKDKQPGDDIISPIISEEELLDK